VRNFTKDVFASVTGVVLWFTATIVAMVFTYPLVVLAENADVIPSMPDTSQFFEALWARHWPLAVALGVTWLVWLVRYVIKDRFPPKTIPYIMLACAVLSGGAGRIIQAVSENHTWWMAMIQGLIEGATVGLGSMGAWSAGGKKVLPAPKRE
jgi:hypothetical protein